MVKKKQTVEKVKVVMNDVEMARAIRRLANQIIELNKGAENIVLVGIIQRGLPLAKRIADVITKQEGIEVPVGALDVSLYRDDLTQKGKYIEVRKSDMPFTVTGKTVVLVDDVIFAGRTARAALDGLKDYGRSAKVQLVALIDRGHRELPIHPDLAGKVIPTAKKEDVKVEIFEVDGVDRVIIK
ncbi:bifunctional pyr operon transcriptional regulator/uracil phosphoribosyltransferase [candidate division WOR-1 bacterium RIFOXYB2_FULL_42_35]|uniref:Bifunctional protein PyrR n=1 Tax=candidate division WOR-1 bacterium RIFOXYC2_FULL_41_25 TaxID=1802586 RepID=A0A1F4TM69_UNCSA|nr:MAG: bifunctional pyr operon transcriptional regulator/uracil phosphoribosyltransferase [candidate division WOR-1 bacterium RIFOXYA2_FULL_41_14]OGC24144.1 MAG: bifunctional pyr operon transcriptional regulator/uracil phosphoribosyltransferase [candidate division WOR-1 bacterium RIFOXYB2_FULL_42_35]OGC33831.1 MAG: bifunctional pyr operon transcriptional regulator/uracil phosphoribosyltransferase [candidate division WOR-1 bacterium RIFOXYC2_FULL_41_25]OGC41811.1 MAG: bifunctional pyr operon tra